MDTASHYWYGMGSTADAAVQMSTVAAQAIVPVAIGHTVATALSGMLGITVTTSVAIPIIGAAIAGISLAIEAILHSGCGEACIITSQWANQAEEQLQKNISAYFAIPAPRPKSVQQIAIANFQVIWNRLKELCSQPGLSTAGRNCIEDRQDGACKWKQNVQPAYPGIPQIGECWNWWSGYYYPIVNDADTYDDSITAAPAGGTDPISSAVSSLFGTGAGTDTTLLLLGAAVIGAVLLVNAA